MRGEPIVVTGLRAHIIATGAPPQEIAELIRRDVDLGRLRYSA